MITYAQAVAFLESFIDYEKHRGLMQYNTRALHLERFEAFLRSIGAPHEAVPFVHIAGTKGKGSTAAIVHSIAAEALGRSGLYTSPHLESYCERIQINRSLITKKEFAAAVERLRRKIEAANHALEPGYRTTFELLTALAMEVFKEREVRLAVLETGLGGRLDATNVVVPEVAVVTAIGLDHTHLLGDTHGAIAGEKAAIAKAGRPLVLAHQAPDHFAEIMAVVSTTCRRVDSLLYYAPAGVEIESRDESIRGQIVRCRLKRSESELTVRLPLVGRHQAENLRTALATVEVLRDRGWEIGDEAIVRGVERVSWPGRIEWIEGRPPLVLDGAHCPLSVEALALTLRDRLPAIRPVFLFSILDDKPVAATVRPLARLYGDCEMVVFRAPSVRGCAPELLAAELLKEGFRVALADSPAEAVAAALDRAGPDRPLVAFGSLYSIDAVRKAYRKLTGSPVRK
jgi:dihydrofolate synthase/folylpolyglutamate synthase